MIINRKLEKDGLPVIVMIITTLLTMAALLVIIGGGVFAVAILLLQQQQAGATAIDTTPVAKHKKCSGDLITCTSDKKTSHHSTKDDSTPFNLPLPFP
jgi:hypothetical protein